MNVDLPNLTSINSKGSSFYRPHSVTLESDSKYSILIFLDIPNLKKVNLYHSFQYIQFFDTHSSVSVYLSSVDVHYKLIDYLPSNIYHFDYIQSISSLVSSITIPDWTCNDIDYTIFDVSRFINVESIKIGNDCFGSVKTFKINRLNRLKTIKIGIKSFTHRKDNYGNNESKSFHILNCESLESIQIGEYSFSDFGGEFELKNLPQLQSIQIGTTGTDSYNFSNSSFVLRGIELILNIVMIRSSKSTIYYDWKLCI